MLRQIVLRCPEDDEELLPIKDRIITISEYDEISRGYICPYCLERYVSFKNIPKMEHIFANDKQYINIWPEENVITIKSINRSKKSSLIENINTKHYSSQSNQHIITAHDFVIRRAVFKCRHNNHHIEDVKAVFTTISRQGTINKITIPAGYCSTCNMYFIMESTYKRIKDSGIPICRTLDEKNYLKNNVSELYYNGLASESVLMQFGYNVSQQDNLPAKQRRIILASIVDNGMLKRNEVVSYLDCFINQRRKQKNKDGSLKYKDAMDKWRADRTWINQYKLGSYKEVIIESIVTGKE